MPDAFFCKTQRLGIMSHEVGLFGYGVLCWLYLFRGRGDARARRLCGTFRERLVTGKLTALKVNAQSDIELPSRQVVWHGVLRVCDVSNPVIGIYVVDAEQIEAVYAKPNVFECIERPVA